MRAHGGRRGSMAKAPPPLLRVRRAAELMCPLSMFHPVQTRSPIPFWPFHIHRPDWTVTVALALVEKESRPDRLSVHLLGIRPSKGPKKKGEKPY